MEEIKVWQSWVADTQSCLMLSVFSAECLKHMKVKSLSEFCDIKIF
jgi:hypothetical protein